jgi:hypothetical protein
MRGSFTGKLDLYYGRKCNFCDSEYPATAQFLPRDAHAGAWPGNGQKGASSSSDSSSGMTNVSGTGSNYFKTVRPWLILTAILLVYLFNVERWHPTAFFGRMHDDSIYFSTAKALAEGKGYVLISFPGTPPQTKYPILYPWLLSWVWRVNPHFPDNLVDGIRLTEFFGCWSLVAGFLLLRKLPSMSEASALGLTAICAFQPIFLRFSGTIMSDVPFMALLLTALLLADSATRTDGSTINVVAASVASALSMGMRTIGVTVVAGILLAALRRRVYRQAIVFIAVATLMVGLESWPTMFHHAVTPALSGSNPLEPGWNQVLAYYTDYIGYQWRMGVPTVLAFISMVKLNFLLLVSSPGSVVVGPVNKWASAFTAILSVPIILGMVRQRKSPEWTAIFFVLLFYCALLLVWPFPQPERFLLPFLPLLFAGLWLETRRLGGLLITNLRGAMLVAQRLTAAGIAIILLSLFVLIGWNYLVRDPRMLEAAAQSQMRALAERKQAYDWIRQHTASDDRIAAYMDGAMYLYAGRQGLRPVVFLPAAGYMSDNESLERDLAHITDGVRHIGARYWLTTRDDFDLEVGKERIERRMAEVMSVLPVVFASANNSVQIHDASCLIENQPPECQAAQAVFVLPKH